MARHRHPPRPPALPSHSLTHLSRVLTAEWCSWCSPVVHMAEGQHNAPGGAVGGARSGGAGHGSKGVTTQSLKAALSSLSKAVPLHLNCLNTRSGASAGVWLVVLVPLACIPSLYNTHTDCHPSSRLLALLAIQVGVCGAHLYQEVCLATSHKAASKEGTTSQIPPLLLRLLTHPYAPSLATTLAITLLTDIHPLLALPLTLACSWLLFKTTHWLFTTFPGSFSLGEGAVVGQSVALALTCSIHGLVSRILWPQKLTDEHQISLFIQTAVVVLSVLVGSLYRVPLLRTPRMFLPYLCVCGVVGVGAASLLIEEWLPVWLWELLTHSPVRLLLLGWWFLLTLFAVSLTTWTRRRSHVPTTVLRKVYHVVITLVFLPGVLLEPTFLVLAASAATMACLLLEVVRVEKIPPLAGVITQAFTPFLDEKDEGPLILSHLYLLAGVSAPLWLMPCPLVEAQVGGVWRANTVLPLLAGVLAVGVGDTAASVGGTYLGRRQWSGTKKTVEGSLCGVVAQMAVVGVLVAAGWVHLSLAGWGRLMVSAAFVGVVEALTDQVDNIVLPLILSAGPSLASDRVPQIKYRRVCRAGETDACTRQSQGTLLD
ncbi:Dolichol kinase [Chionoecetes opilio]|uniref:dolichol kinase n=1 Tax=Chionoecetes opilio TaxID=41210 RepID=A0A8J4Y6D7_CHIOP|nr:Dolichol kinase [Chionoecetes opilio]